jgi:T5SS/PEP-CTERM-associated repeat protein
MRNLDHLLAAKFRLREWLARSARAISQVSLLALLLSSPTWGQDTYITTPTNLTGDDPQLSTRVLVISGAASNNASLNLLSGSGGSGARVSATGLVVGNTSNQTGLLSITGGSQVLVNDPSVNGGFHSPPFTAPGLSLRQGASLNGAEAGTYGTVNVSGIGSSFTSQNRLYIGWQGNGNLMVENGAAVSKNVAAFVGGQAGSIGKATITGPGRLRTDDPQSPTSGLTASILEDSIQSSSLRSTVPHHSEVAAEQRPPSRFRERKKNLNSQLPPASKNSFSKNSLQLVLERLKPIGEPRTFTTITLS